MVEEALRLNVQCSLQALSKAVNGDSKTSPNPLFRVQVVLTQDTSGSVAQVKEPLLHTPTRTHTHTKYCTSYLNLLLALKLIVDLFRVIKSLITHFNIHNIPVSLSFISFVSF